MSAAVEVAVRRALLAVAACGFLLFGGLWLLSMARPHLVEQVARTLLVKEVERRVRSGIGARLQQIARLDARIVNKVLEALGSAVSAAPC